MSTNSLKYPSVRQYAEVMTLFMDQVPTPQSNGMSPSTKPLGKRTPKQKSTNCSIINIRSKDQLLDLSAEIRAGLAGSNKDNLRSFPSLLLWDERGLKYFEENIEPGSILLELRSGCLRKTNILLKAIDAVGKHVDYHALDLDRNELQRTSTDLRPSNFQYVRCSGLLGTHENGLAWLDSPANVHKPRVVLSLGSTIGSFIHDEAAELWSERSATLQGPRDSPVEEASVNDRRNAQIITGLDACKDKERMWRAYNDAGEANRRFILNVLDHANKQLGYKAFDLRDWNAIGEWDAARSRHTQYLVPLKEFEFEGIKLSTGEKIFVVHSHKYDEGQRDAMWEASSLSEDCSYMSEDGSYGLHVLTPAEISCVTMGRLSAKDLV